MTIGRALRLVVSLTGGGFPGRLDRATLGHAGQDRPVLRRERGGRARGSRYQVSAASLPAVRRHGGRRRRAAVDLRPPQPGPWSSRGCWASAAAATWSPTGGRSAARSLFVICPEHARSFAERGLEQAATARGDVRRSPPSRRRAALGRDHAARARRPLTTARSQVVVARGHSRRRRRRRGRTLLGGVRTVLSG